MAATFEWHVEFLQTDPNDDNFIKFITCGIYGTENGVTKKQRGKFLLVERSQIYLWMNGKIMLT